MEGSPACADLIALYEEHNSIPLSDWEFMPKGAVNEQFDDKAAPSLRAWKRSGLTGGTSFVLKSELTLPHI